MSNPLILCQINLAIWHSTMILNLSPMQFELCQVFGKLGTGPPKLGKRASLLGNTWQNLAPQP